MGWVGRIRWALVLVLFLGLGCSQNVEPASDSAAAQRVRVRILQDVDRVDVMASANPNVSVESNPAEHILAFPPGAAVPVALDGDLWKIGNITIGRGVMTIKPGAEGSIRVDKTAYRGYYKFYPIGGGKFDVINDVDIDGYLKGVVAKEMYPSWHTEAFKAQAVVARTYALYEAHTGGLNRYWDLYPDQRSQVYGGIDGETSRSVEAVTETSGVVLTFGEGEGKIFKAYFSSCCGGVTQAVSDAFPGEPYIEPLGEHVNGTTCIASKFFNWGPIRISKGELGRRFKLWADKKGKAEGRVRPELSMAAIYRIDVVDSNRYGRPSRVVITDTRGAQYNWAAEELRTAVNTDAAVGTTLPSSFCKINGDPNSDSVVFFEGHGYGHGVGMCQWCAEERAAAGQQHEAILMQAFPGAKMVRAY